MSTFKWAKDNKNDDRVLDNVINKFVGQLETINKEQEKKDLERKQRKEEEDSDMAYYLYYQDTDDSTSTVIGLPSPNQASDPIIFKRFIGSLRNTGFGGNIIIGLEINSVSKHLMDYLNGQNVAVINLVPVECTFEFAKKNQKCYHPYSHIKREWSYFALARDWLASCRNCVGSVTIAYVKDTIFQLNPFGMGMPIISRLHVYQQHPNIIAADTSAGVLLKACNDIDLDKTTSWYETDPDLSIHSRSRLRILNAGIAIGPRDDVIDYLGAIHSVTREWMYRSQCHFEHSTSDDGMAIVNYLRLEGRLPHRTRIIPHRTGIVNDVKYDGLQAYEAHSYLHEFKGLSKGEIKTTPYEGATDTGWINTEYLFADKEGQFIDIFFQKSAIVYNYHAFGQPYLTWLDKKLNLTSSIEITSSVTNTGNQEDGEKNDYYMKDNEGKAALNSTSITRKVKNANETSSELHRASDETKVEAEAEAEAEEEREQPMYYQNSNSGDNTNETNSTNIAAEEQGKAEDKTAQIVPVEETHEENTEEEKKTEEEIEKETKKQKEGKEKKEPKDERR